jgi:hypothetical protein
MKVLLRKLLRGLKKNNLAKGYSKVYKKCIQVNPEFKNYVKGEEEWLAKWRKYDKSIKPIAYRIFSHYIGHDLNILPLEYSCRELEPQMTPYLFTDYYNDKNSFHKLYSKDSMPIVYLRNLRGYFMDADYRILLEDEINKRIEDINAPKIVVKPSRKSCGRGFCAFERIDGHFVNADGNILSVAYLQKEYKRDFLIMEWANQSLFMSQFNNTSLNIIRIATYRDKLGVLHPLNASLCFGGVGEKLANPSHGGISCGISKEGVLANYVFDEWGKVFYEYNGINFKQEIFHIPNWDKVQDFAVLISNEIIHHDLVALDLYLDENNNPKLVESNVGSFAAGWYQRAGYPAFGEFTDEILQRYTSGEYDEDFRILL